MSKTFSLTIALAAVLYLSLPLPGLSAPLSEKIDRTRDRIEEKHAREGVLTSQMSAYSTRIRSLQGEISGLQSKQDKVQVELDQEQARLNEIRDRLQRTQDRLAKLRLRLAASKAVLAKRLVALYKDDAPDMVTVVLEADGFADLLDRAEFISRISEQDNRIVTRVRDLTRQVTKQAKELAALEAEQQDVTGVILAKRNEIAAAKGTVVKRQNELVGARDKLASARARITVHRHELEGNLKELERQEAARAAKIAAAQNVASAGSVPAAPIKRGSGDFIFPVSGPITSGFGMRWGRLHAGIDISAGEGTPIRAAASGTVSLMQPTSGSGGYGNYTCISHGGSISTCYAHQSRFGTSSGASVSQGQVIGYVGNTGHSFGAHLHFEVRVNGSPVDPLGYL